MEPVPRLIGMLASDWAQKVIIDKHANQLWNWFFLACERQTFLLAHRRWGTVYEEELRRPISASDRIPGRCCVISMEFLSLSRRLPSSRRLARRNVCLSQARFFYFAAFFSWPMGRSMGSEINGTKSRFRVRLGISDICTIRACILNEDSKSIWSRRPGIVLVDLVSNFSLVFCYILTFLLWFDQLWVARGGGGARLGFFVFLFSLSFVFNICLASTDWRVVVSHDVRR